MATFEVRGASGGPMQAAYLEQHQVLHWMQEMLEDLVKEQPDSPWSYIAQKAKQQEEEELVEKGNCSILFEDFKEEGVMVHPSSFPDLIGKKGVTIKAFKSQLNVEVTIPEVPKNATQGTKKYKVTLAGKGDDVRKAKDVLESIRKYGYHELTHPGQTHEELEIEAWAYKYLIGKGGSEVRHIQNNYQVKVNIPREHSACQNVVVVGDPIDVSRAKDYIDNLMWKVQNAPTGWQGQDSAIDPWGDVDVEEEWMKDYIYKR